MYDKFILRLDDAQVCSWLTTSHPIWAYDSDQISVVDSSVTASKTEKLAKDSCLLERTSIRLEVQTSIVPSATNIAQFRATGALPQLHINFSDSKYEAIMGFISAAIPTLGPDQDSPSTEEQMDLTTSFFDRAGHTSGDDVLPGHDSPAHETSHQVCISSGVVSELMEAGVRKIPG
jgi:hypothetical protein